MDLSTSTSGSGVLSGRPGFYHWPVKCNAAPSMFLYHFQVYTCPAYCRHIVVKMFANA